MKYFSLFVLFVFIFGCGGVSQNKRIELAGFTQGTTYKIVYYSDSIFIEQETIDLILADFSKSCSVYDTASLISRINRNETDRVDRYITDCEKIARELYIASKGAYDITSYPLSKAYGFLRENKEKEINLDSILNLIGHSKINIKDGRIIKGDPRITIDLNSIAQGYSVDLVADYIKNLGITNFLVEIGGEVYCSGTKPDSARWQIGIDRPVDGNMVEGEDLQAIISVKDLGVNTSGNYRKFYVDDKGKRVNHIIDPRTGESSVSDMLSATVMTQSTALADALATMLMVVGSTEAKNYLLENRDRVEGYIIYHENDSILTYSTFKEEI